MPPSPAYGLKSEDAPFDDNNESWLGPTSPFSIESYPTQYQLDLMNGWWGNYLDGLPYSDEPSPVEASPVYSGNPSETYSRRYSAQKESSSLTIWAASAQNNSRRGFQTSQPELRGGLNDQRADFESYTEFSSPSDPQSSVQTPTREKYSSTDRVQEVTSPTSSKGRYDERRRSQNRDAQRAFRARQRIHMQYLEERLQDLTARHMRLKKDYLELGAKYNTLLEEPQRGDSDYEDNLDSSEAGYC